MKKKTEEKKGPPRAIYVRSVEAEAWREPPFPGLRSWNTSPEDAVSVFSDSGEVYEYVLVRKLRVTRRVNVEETPA